MVRYVVFVNDGAGSVSDDDREGELAAIEDAFAGTGVEVDVRLEHPARLAATLARTWAEPDRPGAVVVAGGDGTVNAAVGAAAGTDLLLGVLPMGTFNHFAKDLGLPTDLPGAAAALAAGQEAQVDVGEVNGRVFVNNSALGVYPEMVALRDRLREQRGWGKVRAVPVAAWRVARSFPVHRLELRTSDEGAPEAGGVLGGRPTRTPFVFVGNGSYADGPGGPTVRSSMEDGRLEVVVARVRSRWGLVRAMVGALVAHPDVVRDVERLTLSDVRIDGRTSRIKVALDGEVCELDLPLHYRSRPGALRVLVGPDRP
ncbi:MAG: diacylglycerol kinase family lipid kinase [Actinobacteria bacterium]|nr:diacylglycerol kinase family lipid kinase [Actinomycetota bacterium]